MTRPNHVTLLASFLFCVALSLAGCSREVQVPDPSKPHRTSAGFRNTDGQAIAPGLLDLARYYRAMAFADRPPVPADLRPRVPDLGFLQQNRAENSVTWIGHATVLVQIAGLNVLIDPQFSDTASPVSWFGPRRRVGPALSVEELPGIDVVLVSHDHYDHLDAASVKAIAAKFNPQFIVPLGVDALLREWGVTKVHALDWWESTEVATRTGVNVQLHCVPAHHWSKRGFFGANQTLWAGFVIRSSDFGVYFSGDTGYSEDFKAIGAKFGPLDMAILPLGSWAPRWFMKPLHIDAAEAVQIHRDVRARRSLGVHWGAFDLATEPIDSARTELPKALAAAGVPADEFVLFQIGETAIWRPEPAADTRGSSRYNPKRQWRKGEPR